MKSHKKYSDRSKQTPLEVLILFWWCFQCFDTVLIDFLQADSANLRVWTPGAVRPAWFLGLVWGLVGGFVQPGNLNGSCLRDSCGWAFFSISPPGGVGRGRGRVGVGLVPLGLGLGNEVS